MSALPVERQARGIPCHHARSLHWRGLGGQRLCRRQCFGPVVQLDATSVFYQGTRLNVFRAMPQRRLGKLSRCFPTNSLSSAAAALNWLNDTYARLNQVCKYVRRCVEKNGTLTRYSRSVHPYFRTTALLCSKDPRLNPRMVDKEQLVLAVRPRKVSVDCQQSVLPSRCSENELGLAAAGTCVCTPSITHSVLRTDRLPAVGLSWLSPVRDGTGGNARCGE